MKYIDEFRNAKRVKIIASKLTAMMPKGSVRIMEVCGTHTQNFRRFALSEIIPTGLQLIAGPGCPVCVSPCGFIDKAIALAKQKDVLIVSFGDMLRVPGSCSTLERERASSGNVRLAYSPLESLQLAQAYPQKKVVFLAVGFETTAPAIALAILAAKKNKLKNLFFLCALKRIPAAMEYLLQDKRLNLAGFLCPGHVSAIIGLRPYQAIVRRYRVACCIAGFEPLDILQGLYFLLLQVIRQRPQVVNQYVRVVQRQGNPRARKIISEVFSRDDALWRGLGRIPKSGLSIKENFAQFDAARIFNFRHLIDENKSKQNLYAGEGQRTAECKCADILKGIISPPDCPLFSLACSPQHPLGPCMVSSEGACNAYYRYR